MMKKIFASFLVFVFIFSSVLPFDAMENNELTSGNLPYYRASEYFVADTAYVTNTPWTWQYYNKTTAKYVNYNYIISGALLSNGEISSVYDFPADENLSDANLVAGLSVSGAGSGTITKYWMKGPGANNGGINCATYFTTRTFKAPHSGKVLIYAVDSDGSLGLHGANYTNGSANAKVKILKNGTQIWPEEEGGMAVNPGKGNNHTIEPIEVELTINDEIHFMLDTSSCRDTSKGGSTWDDIKRTPVYWDPIVAYTAIEGQNVYDFEDSDCVAIDNVFTIPSSFVKNGLSSENIKIYGAGNPSVKSFNQNEDGSIEFDFENLQSSEPYVVKITDESDEAICIFNFTTEYVLTYNSYKASDYFEETTQTNPSGPWQWGYYDVTKDTYVAYETLKEFDTLKSYPERYPIPTGESEEVLAKGYMHNWTGHNGIITKYWITMSGNLENDDFCYPTKTFTAPESGGVSVSCVDYDGEAKISGLMYENTSDFAPKVKIIKEDTGGDSLQIWPLESNEKSISVNTKVSFDTLEINVNKGDKLHFSLDCSGVTQWSQARNCYIYWDPQVSYNSYFEYESFSPKNLKNLSVNQIFTLTSTNELEEVFAEDIEINSDGNAYVNNFSFINGKTISFDFAGLNYDTVYDISINNLKTVGSKTSAVSYKFSFSTMPLSFKASDYYYSASSKNPNAPWQWGYYDVSEKEYVLFYDVSDSITELSASDVKDRYTFPNGTIADYSGFTKGGNANSGAVNKFWMVAPTIRENALSKYVVKTFSAFESGDLTITSEDYNGNNYIRGLTFLNSQSRFGPDVRIIKEKTNGDEVLVWPNNNENISVRPNSEILFEPVNVNISKGEKLHFILDASKSISDETGYALENSVIYWNPIVTYNEIHSTLVSQYPLDGAKDIDADTEFVLTYDMDICSASKNDIVIDGGAEVDYVITNGKNLCFAFKNLKELETYTVKVKNIKPFNMPQDNNYEHSFSFTTGLYTSVDDFSVNDGANVLSDGLNTVSTTLRNTVGESYKSNAVVIVALCKGTQNDYIIEEVNLKVYEDFTGSEDVLIKVDVPDASGRFLKIIAVDNLKFGKALTDEFIIKEGVQ